MIISIKIQNRNICHIIYISRDELQQIEIKIQVKPLAHNFLISPGGKRETHHFWDLGVDGKTMLKFIFISGMEGNGLDRSVNYRN